MLRVCADPNNLPFSNDARRRLRESHRASCDRARLAQVGHATTGSRSAAASSARRSHAGMCDVVIGVPASLRDGARDAAVLPILVRVRRRAAIAGCRSRHSTIRGCAALRIGIPITGDDYENPAAGTALAVRHIFDNVRGYPVYGDYSKPHPSSGLLDARAPRRGRRRHRVGTARGVSPRSSPARRFDLSPVPARDGSLPFTFDIAMGVRRGDTALAAALDAALERRALEIRRILARYGVPLANRRPEVWRMNTPRILLTLVGAGLVARAGVLPPRQETIRRRPRRRRRSPHAVGPLPGPDQESAAADQPVRPEHDRDVGGPRAVRPNELLRLPRRPRWRRHGAEPARRGLAVRQHRRADLQHHRWKDARTGCRRGARSCRRTRSGSSSPTSSRCGRRMNRIPPVRAQDDMRRCNREELT